MVKVKICGITNLADGLMAAQAGAQAVGFIFYRKSPRYISPKQASKISKRLPRGVFKVGVFVNSDPARIKKIARCCRLDMLQFHGEESSALCAKFKGYKVIKAFRVKESLDWEKILSYRTFAYLFDTYDRNSRGGSGKNFNWSLLVGRKKIKVPVFLSGGVNQANILPALRAVGPDWLDVSSSLESAPGKKDPQRVKSFMQAVKKSRNHGKMRINYRDIAR